jgi:transcriptional regulator with XRE-family HTH domain
VFTNLPRAVRALRHRQGWTQSALGARIGVSRELISRMERGDLAGVPVGTLRRVATELDATVSVQIRWRGEELDRLVDAQHAKLQQAASELLLSLGWVVRIEVSFNHFGDRGRIDILAKHPVMRILLVLEVKTGLGDLQETLGRLDVKTRLGRRVALELGWSDVAAVVPVLVIGDTRTSRSVVARYDALFQRFSLRGRAAVAWLRRPRGEAPPGLLWFANGHDSRQT